MKEYAKHNLIALIIFITAFGFLLLGSVVYFFYLSQVSPSVYFKA